MTDSADFNEQLRIGSPEALRELVTSPDLDEGQVVLLLARKDLPGELIEEIAKRKPLLKNYAVKRALVLHRTRHGS